MICLNLQNKETSEMYS